MTSRNFCITFFQKPILADTKLVRYAIYGLESCPTTKKQHWQSYVEFVSPIRISAIKKMYNDNTLHAEKRKGTRDQAREYCMKDKNFTEHGKWITGQGYRSDLESVVKKLVDKEITLPELMIEEPMIYCKYRNGLRDIAAQVKKNSSKDYRKLSVILLTGPTRCGKTRYAMENLQGGYKTEGYNLKWWEDYEGEDTIVIDEYNNDIPVTWLLQILDGHQVKLPIKGSHTYANWTKVYITTNLKIEEIHPLAKPEHRDALFKRITEIKSFWPKDNECNEVLEGNTNTSSTSHRDDNLLEIDTCVLDTRIPKSA